MLWTFEDFYNHYQKKVGRKDADKAWRNNVKTAAHIMSIMEHVPKYVVSTPDKKYRMHPSTYLNGHHWEDEIIEKPKRSNWGNAADGLIEHLQNERQ